MEILFIIFSVIFGFIAAIFGVKNRIRNTKPGTGSDIRDDRSRHNYLVSYNKQLDADITECSKISGRIRKREQETTTGE